MIDVMAYPLPFGGRAFEPVTDAGRMWCRSEMRCWPGSDIFVAGVACMEGLGPDAVGFEPWDVPDAMERLAEAGLTVGTP